MSTKNTLNGIKVVKLAKTKYYDTIMVLLDIDCTNHIDTYAYHDAPGSIQICLTPVQTEDLISRLQKAIATGDSEPKE